MVEGISVNSTSINGISNYKEILIDSCNKYKDKIVFYEKKGKAKIAHSYENLKNDVFRLGTMLLEIGLKDKHIAIVGENSYGWVVSYLAVINGIGVAVPLDKELSEEQLCKLMKKSDISVLIFSKTFYHLLNILKKMFLSCSVVYVLMRILMDMITLNLLQKEVENYWIKEILHIYKVKLILMI